MPFVAVASGTSSKALADRLGDTAAAALVTSTSFLPAADAARGLLNAQSTLSMDSRDSGQI